MSNKGRLRPCDYTTDPAWHQARKEGFVGPAPPYTGPSGSVAGTPAHTGADSPGSIFEPDSGDESRFDEFGNRVGHSRGDSDTSSIMYDNSMRAKGNTSMPPLTNATGRGKGKGQGGAASGKGVGKAPLGRTQSNVKMSPVSKRPTLLDRQSSLGMQVNANMASPPQAGQTLPTIKLSPSRTHFPPPVMPANAPNPPMTNSGSNASATKKRVARFSSCHARHFLTLSPQTAPSWMLSQVTALRAER